MNKSAIVVCLSDDDYAPWLEVGKGYPIVPEMSIEKLRGFHDIDEHGEDYLYDAAMFCSVQIPPVVAQRVMSFSKQG